jgi:hypothetical protein
VEDAAGAIFSRQFWPICVNARSREERDHDNECPHYKLRRYTLEPRHRYGDLGGSETTVMAEMGNVAEAVSTRNIHVSGAS